jgi:hypothetical protein
VSVTLTKTKETEDNPFLGPAQRVGSKAKSSSTCSGLVWGGSTTTVALGYFDKEPMRVCGGLDNCEMEIVED